MRLGLVSRPNPGLPRIGAALDALVPPESADWIAEAQRVAGVAICDNDSLGNEAHSNCVEVAALQSIRIRRAVVAGDIRRPTRAEALDLYHAWSGWDGSDASDLGTASDTAAIEWQQHGVRWGLAWTDLPTICHVDVHNAEHLKAAVAFLGPVQLDLALPVAWRDEAAVWSLVAGDAGAVGSWGAHRVVAARYDAEGLHVLTWGTSRLIPWPAVARYGLNAEATVSRSWLSTLGLSPGGLDLAELERAGRALAG